jgi:TatD DNase family protein
VDLVDSHCHLNLPEFGADLQPTLDRAHEAGVTRMVVPGVDLETSRQAVDLATRHPGVFAAVGVHPHESGAWSDATRMELREIASDPRVVAIGEIGLDYFRALAPPGQQVRAFQEQLELAAELDLPILIHQRQSSRELLQVLEPWSQHLVGRRRAHPGVMHAFSGDAEAAARGLAAGFLLGVAGPVTYPSARDLRSLLADVPLERLLVETDSPHLPPQPHRGTRNEPSYLPLVAQALGALRDRPLEDIAGQTSANAEALFGWDHGTDARALL